MDARQAFEQAEAKYGKKNTWNPGSPPPGFRYSHMGNYTYTGGDAAAPAPPKYTDAQLGKDKWNDFDHMLQTHRFNRDALQFGPGKSPSAPGRMDWSQVWAGDVKDIRQDYWNQQYEATPYKTSPLHGVGWMPTNQAWNRKQFLLPDQAPADQPWRTKWVASPFSPSLMGQDGLGGGPSHSWDDLRWKMNQPEAYGWRPGKDLTTGRVRSYDPNFSPDIDDDSARPYGSRWASEVLDFDRYNDPNDYYYGSAAKGMGINRYSNLQQILDASDWHKGTWNQPEPPKTTTTGSASTSTLPKLLDVSGTAQPTGGVNSAAWNQTIDAWNKQQANQLAAWNQQQTSQQAAWDKQASGYQSQISGLSSSLASHVANQQAQQQAQQRQNAWGTDYNPVAQGVKINRSGERRGDQLSTRKFWGRGGTNLKNTSLNI